ncbi:MAG: alpha-amylase/4-alpha-glucanotransferase domain-containing protein, partial [bacterium]
AQCNCAYWHGVFGGLYLPHLRQAVYTNLLEAESLCNTVRFNGKPFVELHRGDFDADGTQEVYLRNERVGILLSPREGGAAYELDYLPARFNVLNTLRRQPEAYHKLVAAAGGEIVEGASIHDQLRSKEAGLERLLTYDRHLRGSLIDHFLAFDESPSTLIGRTYYELGDFVGKPYEVSIRDSDQVPSVELSRTASVVDNRIAIKKSIILLDEEDGLLIQYSVKNLSKIPLTIIFAPEFNFALLSGNSPDRYCTDDQSGEKETLNTIGASSGITKFSLMDEGDHLGIHFIFAEPTEIWRFPCETVSQSEEGFERVYQSSCVLPVFRLKEEPGEVFEVQFKLVFELLS